MGFVLITFCRKYPVPSFDASPYYQIMSAIWFISSDDFSCDGLQVTPDVHFQNDLGLDSLDNVEIVMALEEEFKLEIPDKEADKIDSCTIAIEYIAAHPMAG